MQIYKTRHQKNYVVLGKMKNEDSRGLRRLYKWRNFVLKFQDNLHRSKHLRRWTKQAFSAHNALRSAQARKNWC